MKAELKINKTPVITTKEERRVILDMSEKEAVILFGLLGNIAPMDAYNHAKKSIKNYRPDYTKYIPANLTEFNTEFLDPVWGGLDETL